MAVRMMREGGEPGAIRKMMRMRGGKAHAMMESKPKGKMHKGMPKMRDIMLKAMGGE